MKKNVLLILMALAVCIPLLLGFQTVSLIGACALLVYVLVMHPISDFVKCTVAVLVFSAAFGFDMGKVACFILLVMPTSVIMGRGIRKKAGFEYVIIAPTAAFLAVVTALILFFTHKESTTAFNLLFGEAMEILKETLAKTEGMAEYADTFKAQLELLLPSVLIISANFIVYIIFGVSRTVLERHGFFTENMPHFYELRLSGTFTTVFLLMFLFSTFGGAGAVSLNIIMVVTMLFAVCGLSVCDFYLRRGRVPTVVRVLIYITVFVGLSLTGILGSVLLFLLLGVGIFDSYKPLRHTGI